MSETATCCMVKELSARGSLPHDGADCRSQGGQLNDQQIAVSKSFGFESAILKSIPQLQKSKGRILVFEEDESVCEEAVRVLKESGYIAEYANGFEDVLELIGSGALRRGSFEVIVWGINNQIDLQIERLTRLQNEMRSELTGIQLVLLASEDLISQMSEFKSVGVDIVILKPLNHSDICTGIERLLEKKLGSQNYLHINELKPESTPVSNDGMEFGIIGKSLEIGRVINLIRKVGKSTVSVLLTGESGTGKEMVARAIHAVSPRANKPFVAINCAAIPRDLLESELFGHAKGAFTGAMLSRRGLFEEAHEGTILLDEIGDLPLALQAKILRLLQTKEVKPLGQNSYKEVDVRIISATHKNLKNLIQRGDFREDLYYRLNVMPIHLPALRDRKEDVVLLAEHFLARGLGEKKGHPRRLSRKAQSKLLSLPWKGNVRELENVIERAMVLAEGEQIHDTEILVDEIEPTHSTSEDLFNRGMSLKDIEREYIKYVLMRTGNRKEAATRVLGIDRKTLYRKEKAYGIRLQQDKS